MSESSVNTLVRKYFETDLPGATRALESMDESEVVGILKASSPVRAATPARSRWRS